jgi:hypothetical protein
LADGHGRRGGGSEVTVYLNFGPRFAEEQIQEESGEDRDPLKEGVVDTLRAISRQIEEGAGKVQPPSP